MLHTTKILVPSSAQVCMQHCSSKDLGKAHPDTGRYTDPDRDTYPPARVEGVVRAALAATTSGAPGASGASAGKFQKPIACDVLQ